MENGKIPIKYDFVTQLVTKYNLNQNWLATGDGKPTSTAARPASSLVSDLAKINEQVEVLKKYIRIMELNQTHLVKVIEGLEKKVDSLEKKLDKK